MMNTAPYEHRVPYYETDQMGVVHHSNYIRWFEEARDDFMRRSGIDYRQLEAEGVFMPVIRVSCDYKAPAKYCDTAEIRVLPTLFDGVRLRYEYEVRLKESGAVAATGLSEHCFVDAATRRPLNLRKRLPETCEILSRLLETAALGEA